MKEIVKTLLMEGVDEDTIHRVLDAIAEEYEVIDERNDRELFNRAVSKRVKQEEESLRNPRLTWGGDTQSTVVAGSRLLDRAARRGALAGRKQWKKATASDGDMLLTKDRILKQNIEKANKEIRKGDSKDPKAIDIVKNIEAEMNLEKSVLNLLKT